MSYSSSIPNASDPRAQSQGQINANFQAINSVWAVNHANLTGEATQGQHDVLTFRPESNDPTTTANQVALYNKLVSGIPELFFRPKSNATPIQLTYPTVTTGVTAQQQSFVAGPFIIYAGFLRPVGGITNGQVVTLANGTTLLYVNVTQAVATSTNVVTSVIANTYNTPANSFTIRFVANPTIKIPVLYYFAIGV